MDLATLTEAWWRGEARGPVTLAPDDAVLGEVAPGVAFVTGFGNVTALATSEGLVLVDSGSTYGAPPILAALREWSGEPVHTLVYSHGHVDHVFGAHLLDAEAEAAGRPRPRVVAHENVLARFARYTTSAGYNEIVNQRQFSLPELRWRTDFRLPDLTYREALDLEVGGARLALRHARGETDDATITWLPDHRVLAAGDLFVWSSPNAGNPQKALRDPGAWARALREMSSLGAEVLLPGHGVPILGADRVERALDETAEYLEHLVAATLSLMNEGATFAEVLANVHPPAHLAERPYLQPVYDEPEFVLHNVWRLYGGWWDGDPASLHPAPPRERAHDLLELAGGVAPVLERVNDLIERGDDAALRRAGHLVEALWADDPGGPGVAAARERLYRARARAATSTMAKGVYRAAARESRDLG